MCNTSHIYALTFILIYDDLKIADSVKINYHQVGNMTIAFVIVTVLSVNLGQNSTVIRDLMKPEIAL